MFRRIVNVKGVGEAGDGIGNDTAAVQKAIDECSVKGGTVMLSPGTYSTGTLFMKSNVTLHLSKGATLLGRPDPSLYPHIKHNIPSTLDKAPWRAFIYAFKQKNISITGEGVISPNGGHEVFRDNIGDSPDRPFGIHFVRCENIRVEGISLINSAFWVQRYFECENLTIRGISVYAHANYNNDGLDIDGCKRVIVSGCKIDSSDDALCFKSHGNRPCEEVLVTNCILSSHASGIKFGTGSAGGFKQIHISNCVIKPSRAKKVHHPLKAKQGLMGLDFGSVDGGFMEDISISNVNIEGVETPVFMKLGNRLTRVKGLKKKFRGALRRITLSNITARDAGPVSCSITGYPGNRIEKVLLKNISIQISRHSPSDIASVKRMNKNLNQTGTKLLKGNYLNDPEGAGVPENSDHYPYNRIFDSILPSFGFFVRHAKNIVFDSVTVETSKGDRRVPFVLSDVEKIRFNRVCAKKGRKITEVK